MYVNVDVRRPVTFIEGWLDHWSPNQEWKQYWCVLRNETIYFFSNCSASEDSIEGSIALGPESRLEKLDGEERSGYVFHLRTKRSLNTFKTSRFTEREYWKACVEGIAHGKFSDAIDLLPGQKEDIRNLLHQFLNNRRQSTSVLTPGSAECNIENGFDTPNNSTSGCFTQNNDTSGYLNPFTRQNSTTTPSQKYKFYTDPSRTDTPSWFFSLCTRELAKKILTVGSAFGNTLMRESPHGGNSLVISKRMETASSGQDFTHYMLQWTTHGYKIEVENYHEPMQSLSEVMDFFVATSGKMTTWPMKSNDLQRLGIKECVYNDYNTRIVPNPARHDPDSGEETIDSDVTEVFLSTYKRGPPDIIAPPVPHISKNNVQQYNTGNPRWTKRAESFPNINAQVVEQFQSVKLTKDKPSILKIPSIPSSSPSDEAVPPPLPPNHPPPTKSLSQSTIKFNPVNLNAKVTKPGPKHTQSLSSADIKDRKTSPRDQHSACKARDELASVSARINKQKEEPEASHSSIKPEIKSDLEEGMKSPTVATESFKKILEGIIVNQHTPVKRPPIPNINTSLSDNYESIAHYQNANEIQSAKK